VKREDILRSSDSTLAGRIPSSSKSRAAGDLAEIEDKAKFDSRRDWFEEENAREALCA
jgi:hypothetical protein